MCVGEVLSLIGCEVGVGQSGVSRHDRSIRLVTQWPLCLKLFARGKFKSADLFIYLLHLLTDYNPIRITQ